MKLVQDENQLLENILRTLLQELVVMLCHILCYMLLVLIGIRSLASCTDGIRFRML